MISMARMHNTPKSKTTSSKTNSAHHVVALSQLNTIRAIVIKKKSASR